MKQAGVYAIENTVNGKCYVGSAVHISARWYTHRTRLRHSTHENQHLQAAWQKYGEVAFTFRVLEECPPDLLTAREQHWMDTLDSVARGYNIRPRAESNRGLVVSPETRARMGPRSRALYDDPAQRARVSQQSQVRWADPVYRDQAIAQLRALIADPVLREQRTQRLRDALTNPVYRQRRSETQRARMADPALRAHHSQRLKEYCADPAVRARKSEQMRARYADPAARERQSAAVKAGKARRKAERAAAADPIPPAADPMV